MGDIQYKPVIVPEIDRLENDYYSMQLELCNVAADIVRGRLLIRRSDTNAVVPPMITARGESETQVVAELIEKVASRLNELSTPYNWGSDAAVQDVVRGYLQYRNDANELRLAINDAANQARLDEVHELLHKLNKLIETRVIALVGQIASLTIEQMVRLVESDAGAFNDPTDPWNLDDITARQRLYAFLINPPNAVVEAHSRHEKRLQGIERL